MAERLSRTGLWNPLGESMWSILAKLATQNHLSWKTIRDLVGIQGARSLKSEVVGFPDRPGQIDLARLGALTDWHPDLFVASYSDSYRPYWMKGRGELAHTSIPLVKRTRICPACAAVGEHLSVHQMRDWINCPIHGEPLSTCCPRCSATLPTFAFLQRFPFNNRCGRCDWRLWVNVDTELPNQPCRLAFVNSYQTWIQTLKNTLGSPHGQVQWLEEPTQYNHCAHAHALVPGPEQIERGFVNARRVARTFIAVSELPSSGASRQLSQKKIVAINSHDDCSTTWPACQEYDWMKLIAHEFHQSHYEIRAHFKASGNRSGVLQHGAQQLSVQFGRGISCWETGFWLWRRSLDSVFPMHRRAQNTRQEHFSATGYWKAWQRGMGRVILSGQYADNENGSHRMARTLSSAWVAEYAMALYLLFSVLSCRPMHRHRLNAQDLHSEIVALEALPLFCLDVEPERTTLFRVCTMKPLTVFLNLRDGGLIGNDEYFLQRYLKLTPLFDAIGLLPHIRKRWSDDAASLHKTLELQPGKGIR